MTCFCYKESFDRGLKIDYATFCQQLELIGSEFKNSLKILSELYLICDLYDFYYSKTKDSSIDFE